MNKWTCSMEWECEHESETAACATCERSHRVKPSSESEHSRMCKHTLWRATQIRKFKWINLTHNNFETFSYPETRMPFNLWTHSSAPHKLLCFNNIFKHQKPQIVSSLLSTQPVVWSWDCISRKIKFHKIHSLYYGVGAHLTMFLVSLRARRGWDRGKCRLRRNETLKRLFVVCMSTREESSKVYMVRWGTEKG